jgi:hypothetical protein
MNMEFINNKIVVYIASANADGTHLYTHVIRAERFIKRHVKYCELIFIPQHKRFNNDSILI